MPGPPPKDPSTRARRNADPIPQTLIAFRQGKQPSLPAKMPVFVTVIDPETHEETQVPLPWPAQTRAWWRTWGASPLAVNFTDDDWQYLLDTAVLHGRLWSGNGAAAAELRLRVANFGQTPADRARLRIFFADADQADAKRPEAAPSAKERRGVLRSLPSPASDVG